MGLIFLSAGAGVAGGMIGNAIYNKIHTQQEVLEDAEPTDAIF